MATAVLDHTAVGAAVRRLRQAKRLTLEQVSKPSGLDTGNLSRIERGELGWSFSTLSAIATHGLKMSVAELIAEASRGVGVGVSTEIVVSVPIVKLEDIREVKLQTAIRRATERVKTTAEVSANSFAFRYRGKAMPDFRDGEVIVVDPDVTPGFGQLVVVQTEEGVLFRSLEAAGQKSYLLAGNKQFPALALKRSHKILGVARQAIRAL